MSMSVLDLTDKRVAVVGNAQSLFSQSYGDDIDNHDLVIRINRAAQLVDVSPEYRKSHGTRTDIWCMWRYDEYKDIDVIKPRYIHQMAWWIDDQPDGAEKINTEWFLDHTLPWTPSTGLMVLAWLSKSNCTVDIYGFDWKATPTYTDPEGLCDQTHIHNFELEQRICEDYFVAFKEYKFWT